MKWRLMPSRTKLKRGRPKLKSSTRPASPPLSMVQQNNMYSRPSFEPAINVAAPPAGWDSLDNFFNNPLNIQLFNAQLNIMMQGFEQPPDALTYNIDPILNMMLTRAQDVAYASINFDALIYLYAKIKNREWMMQNNQAYANYGYCNNSNEQSQSLDLSTKGSTSTAIAPTGSSLHKPKSSNVNSNDRTYAELQTVRSGGKAIDATQVLRQHQEASSEPTASTSSEAAVTKTVEASAKEDEVPTVKNNPITSKGGRPIIKQEAMTPLQAGNMVNGPGSINMLSVRPAPASVSVVSSHMGNQEKIGEGDKVVNFTYGNCNFGPIYVKSEEEVKAIVALTQAKIEEREYRDKNGGRRTHGVFASTAAIRARSILSTDIVSYLDRAFTKRGMKENIVGRKRRNYPKRSAIIKMDSKTGALIYPAKKDSKTGNLTYPNEKTKTFVKTEQVEEEQPTSKKQKMTEVTDEITEVDVARPFVLDGIDKIITNTNNLTRTEAKEMESSTTLSTGKISKALFSKRKKSMPNALTNSQDDVSVLPESSITPKNVDKETTNIADRILQTSEANMANAPPAPPTNQVVKHSFNTRSQESNQKSNLQVSGLLTVSGNEVYVRKSKSDKINLLLEKKRKKDEKNEERKRKKLQRSRYLGMGDSVKSVATNLPNKFSKAQIIGGRKMVLKESGEVIEMKKISNVIKNPMEVEVAPQREIVQQQHSKRPQISQDERDVIDKLIEFSESITENIQSQHPTTSSYNDNKIIELNPSLQMMEFEMLQSRAPDTASNAISLDDLLN